MSADKEVKGCGRHYSTVSSRNRWSMSVRNGQMEVWMSSKHDKKEYVGLIQIRLAEMLNLAYS